MDNSSYVFRLFVGGVFVVFGIYAIVSRDVSVGFGGGRGISPLFSMKVVGRAAVLLGVTQIIGGGLFAASFFFYKFGETLSSEFLSSLPSVGILIAFSGLCISPFLSRRSSIQYRKTSHPLIYDDNTNIIIKLEDKGHTKDGNN